MKILVLEDNENRIECFKQVFDRADLVIVETSYDAIQLLDKTQYDFIFLDHDLGIHPVTKQPTTEVMLPSGDGTGYEVAQFIARSKKNKDTPTIIHTFNPDGAKKMMEELEDADYFPFWSGEFKSAVQYINLLIDEECKTNATK